eukprot:TRINITY_DN4363_c0_g1_i14.p1 TRINITY_DN4363_c0_g1~~TRINITY_DN4363_c0_g1_i14.p1  ORF type:complete len:516 (-),score=66.57 TRINITY_DN4363_c0_g1_i14:570-2117(-)
MPLPTASERAAQYAEKKAKLLQAKKDREQPRALPKPAHPVRNKTLADDGASRAREYAAKRRPVVQQKGAAAQSLRKLKARVGAQSQVHRIAGVARSLMCALPEGATEHELLELLDFGGTIQQVQLDGSNALLVFGEPSQAENVFHSAEDPGFVLRDVTLSIQRLGAPMEALVAEGDAFLKAAADGNLEHVAQVMGKADEKGIQHCHLCDRTQEGLTPLMLATRGGHNAVVETLLKSQLADALRSHVDCEGRISLAQAILAGHATLIPALLSDGPITPAAHDLGMATPLHHAIAEALPLEQIRWLLPSGDLSAQDLSGCTAMMLAIASDGFSEEQLIQVSDLLVTRETLHLTDTNGNSALHLALMHRRYKVSGMGVRLSVRRGCSCAARAMRRGHCGSICELSQRVSSNCPHNRVGRQGVGCCWKVAWIWEQNLCLRRRLMRASADESASEPQSTRTQARSLTSRIFLELSRARRDGWLAAVLGYGILLHGRWGNCPSSPSYRGPSLRVSSHSTVC